MPRRAPSPLALLLGSLCACGGARGDGPRIEPQGGQLTRTARVEQPVARREGPVAVAMGLPTTEIAATKPGIDLTYPLYGVAFHMLAQVYAEPSDSAAVVGYLRRGGLLRAKEGVRGKGCDTRWHAVLGGGFVCAGRGFLLGDEPQAFTPSPGAPSLHDALPYPYAKTLAREVPQYVRLPSVLEERETAAQLASLLVATVAQTSALARKSDDAALLAKAGDAHAKTVPAAQALPALVRMVMQPGFYVSVDGRETDGERALVRTVRGAYVPAETLGSVEISAVHGAALRGDDVFPLALSHRKSAHDYRRDPMTGALTRAEPLALLDARTITDRTLLHERKRYLLARDGSFLPEEAVRVVTRAQRPPLVSPRARWIDVSLSTQSLVAYEGDRPVFATLVSTGKQGHETPTGIFRIHSKHVSTTMDGEADTDEAYSIEDVPWTMYFSGNFALHAAFWHTQFGHVRSHGCVNLAPHDARWLFSWAGPELPSGFHGAMATRDNPGTFVVIRP